MTQINQIASQTLADALELITKDRNEQHGEALENHENIAYLWSAYKGVHYSARDVALMMALLKIARTTTGADNPDDFVDAIGYTALANQFPPFIPVDQNPTTTPPAQPNLPNLL